MKQNVETIETGQPLSGQILIGRDIPPGELKGSYYLNADWYQGTAYLTKDRIVRDLSLKYNLQSKELEVMYEHKIKLLPSQMVDSFQWYDRNEQRMVNFINGSRYSFEDSQLIGYLEVVVNGRMKLVKRQVLKVRPPTYVRGLDVGDRNAKLYTEEERYIVKQGELIAVQKNHAYNLQLFQDNEEVLRFIKQNKLRLNKNSNLIEAVNFSNGGSTSQ